MPCIVWAMLVVALPAQDATPPLPYLNPDLPAADRAVDLAARMSLAEKVSQMQDVATAIPRLGIPSYNWWNEALHGVARAGLATSFPQAIGLAATWDTDLMRRVGDAISTEARAKYHEAQRNGDHSRYRGLTFWSPNINIFRDPRWGRGHETYGEDPFLTGRMAVAFIDGMQGNDPKYLKTVATAKHFAVHSGPEPARHSFNVQASEETLNGTYLTAFRASVVDGKAFSIMCAYNAVDGVPACASADLLQSRLRDTWGFAGYVVSDCGAVTDIANGHHFAPSVMTAAAAAVHAGTDLSCGSEYARLGDAVNAGLVAEAVLDRSIVRLFTARFKLGMFDPPERVPYAAIPYSENNSPAHRALALEAAGRSIVLLKNSGGVLPLDTGIGSLAVIGPAADWPDMQLGNYFGTPSKIVTPLEGIRQRFGGTARVSFALGSTYTNMSPALVPAEALQLLGEYFTTSDFSGTPALSRNDSRVYFNWDTQDADVVSRIARSQFSVRWTGSLLAPYSGDYVIGLSRPECQNCSGRYVARLYLDDRLVVSETTPRNLLHQTRSAHVSLDAGVSYRFRLEYSQQGGNPGIELVWIPPADALLAEAVQTARQSDVAVVFVGLNADLEGEESSLRMPGFLQGDRTDIQLPVQQQQLLRAVLDTGKPVVVVLMTGSAIVAAGAEEDAAAVLQAWYPGEEGGNAIARTLAGDNNPSGRLPVTFYKSVDQLPPFDDYSMAGRTYRFFSGKPLYGFGYGLSYSHFIYADLAVDGNLHVSARIANDSGRAGDEVVQVYANRQLAAFTRVHLDSGESRVLEFDINPDLVSGAESFTVSVGGGQPVEGSSYMQIEGSR